VGYDIYYSGTVGAAREGLIHGIPAVAFSLSARPPFPFDVMRPAVVEVLRRVRDMGPTPEVLLNVNLPAPREGAPAGWLGLPGVKGLKTTTLGKRFYGNEIVSREDPRGRPYFWIAGAWPRIDHVEGTDCEAVRQGWVSVTALGLDATDHPTLASLARDFNA
jgi:5'-nucleotidase